MEKCKINSRGVVKGIIFSIISTLILVVVIALASYFLDISDKVISVLLFFASVISILTGAILVTKTTDENGLVHGGLIGVGYFIVMLVASFIIKREFDFNINLLTMLISNTAGGMLGGILGINSR